MRREYVSVLRVDQGNEGKPLVLSSLRQGRQGHIPRAPDNPYRLGRVTAVVQKMSSIYNSLHINWIGIQIGHQGASRHNT